MKERNTLKIEGNNLVIGGVTAKDLALKFGTPLFVFDKSHIVDMCSTYKNAIAKYYGCGLALYASKAYSAKGIYRIIKQCGLGCDVVSAGELYTAIKSGFDTEKIFFHGNNKTLAELQFAIENNIGYIVIDSLSEATDIDKICFAQGKKQKVLIRVNPGVEAHTHHYIQTAKTDSKFGFAFSNGDADYAVNYISKLNNLDLCGLHCHIGSQIFEQKSFILAAEKMVDYYARMKKEYGIEFNLINLGGGFGIHYNSADPYMTFEDYDRFVKVISETLNSKITEYGLKKPYLIIEPGRSIVGEAGVTLYTVGRIKQIKDIKNYLAVDGGMFENPRFALYQAVYEAIAADRANESKTQEYTIAGKCCESGDIIAENIKLPKMNEGDLIAVLSTGAYNYSMASNYNRNLIPPTVIVENSKAEYLVKPQSFDDLLRNDV